MNAIEKLNEIIRSGKKYLYHKDTITINGFKERSGMYTLNCIKNGNNIDILKEDYEKLDTFLSILVEFDDIPVYDTEQMDVETNLPEIKSANRSIQLLDENREKFKTLSEILIEDIKKVREDPNYVSQAKSVANSAQTIINLVKLQLEIAKKG